MTPQEIASWLDRIFRERPWPSPLNLFKLFLLPSPSPRNKREKEFLEDPLRSLRITVPPLPKHKERARRMLGQLILGRAAEVVFEDMFAGYLTGTEFHLKDLREKRTDTDYRLYNSNERPIFRINIKFHGSLFKRAKELVGLDPEDCFPLATYKIFHALQKEEQEKLPYIFVIVSSPGIKAREIGDKIEYPILNLLATIYGSPKVRSKRAIEDAMVDYLSCETEIFQEIIKKLRQAEWYILSARRARKLLREKFFERVFALRIPRFTSQFKKAELDMHFSFSIDLTPLEKFLEYYRTGGLQLILGLLHRGDI